MKKSNQSAINDLILTGIPRSGTSYLCSLLHNLTNCVAINEPDRMSGTLRKDKLPYATLAFHASIRDAILKKETIQNKLLNGSLIEDTAILEQYETYQPDISRDDFLLCSKNTLGYLARLQGFQAIMPNTPIITCIRNPIDTIASWKQSFPHLETASAATQHIIGALNDDFISDWQKERLLKISNEPRVAYRRAMFWAYLADWIWENKTKLIIVHYEDIVTRPNDTLLKIFNQSTSPFTFEPKKDFIPSTVRTHKRELLDNEDIKAIEDICYSSAHHFSYAHSL